MISFSQYIILFVVSVLLAGICVLAYDRIIVGKVPYKLLEIDTIQEILFTLTLKPNQTLVDLGCGDGRVLIEAIKLQPKIQCVGVEKAIFPYLLAKYKTRKYKNIRIKLGDVRRFDVNNANIIFAYLMPEFLSSLNQQFAEFLNKQGIIVSVEYPIAKLLPATIRNLTNKSEFANKWYLYHN